MASALPSGENVRLRIGWRVLPAAGSSKRCLPLCGSQKRMVSAAVTTLVPSGVKASEMSPVWPVAQWLSCLPEAASHR